MKLVVFMTDYRTWLLFALLPFVGCALNRQAKEMSSPTKAVGDADKPATAKLHAEMARMLEQTGEMGGAGIHYRKALEISPHDLSAQLGYAKLLVATGKVEQACGWFERARQDHPESAGAYNDLGLCYAECGRSSDALEALSRAAELKPSEVRYRNNLAKLLIEAGDDTEAVQQLLAVHPPAVAHYNAGYLLQSQGKRGQAAEQFRLAAVCDPALLSARRWSSELARREQLERTTAHVPTRLPKAEVR